MLFKPHFCFAHLDLPVSRLGLLLQQLLAQGVRLGSDAEAQLLLRSLVDQRVGHTPVTEAAAGMLQWVEMTDSVSRKHTHGRDRGRGPGRRGAG